MNISLLISLVAIILLLAWTGLSIRNKLTLKLQAKGIIQIQILKQLIEFLQKHRGLSAAKCQGDNSVNSVLLQLKHQINQQIKFANELLSNNERWISYLDHWQRLTHDNENQTTTAENSFQQHTNLIENIVYLLEDTAEVHLLGAEHLSQCKHINLIWRELVNVTEIVGQSRAVGTASVAAGKCNSVEFIRLKFLTTQIDLLSNQVLPPLKADKSISASLINDSLEKTALLSKIIRTEIIGREQIELTRKEYFDLATDTIGVLNTVFDHQLQNVKKHIGITS